MLTLTTTALGGGVLSVSFVHGSIVCIVRLVSVFVRGLIPSKVMNICGVGLGCLMLMTGALLAYLGMEALMDMSCPRHAMCTRGASGQQDCHV